MASRHSKSSPSRPSDRSKAHSTSSLSQKPPAETQLPPFKSASDINAQKITFASFSDPSRSFLEQARRGESLLRQPKQSLVTPAGQSSDASLLAYVRTNPRPRKLPRRSVSMLEHPKDVMNQKRVAHLPLVIDAEATPRLQLPHTVSQDEFNSHPRISKETLIKILDGSFNQVYERFVIIDCRFEYEYDGGHIEGAVNFADKGRLSSHLFNVKPVSKEVVLIFHCEFSTCRALAMAGFIRSKDRSINAEHYPQLTYPQICILDGGYGSFFKDYRSRCSPQNYVEMNAQEHASACEIGLGKAKARSKSAQVGPQGSPSRSKRARLCQVRWREETQIRRL
jgi:M-phase inducer tyrosine phosphatase